MLARVKEHSYFKRVGQYFEFSHWDQKQCPYGTPDQCRCTVTVTGCSQETEGFKVSVESMEGDRWISQQERFRKILQVIHDSFRMTRSGHVVSLTGMGYRAQLTYKYSMSPNCRIIRAPFNYESHPEAKILPSMRNDVENLVRVGDLQYFSNMVREVNGRAIRPFQAVGDWMLEWEKVKNEKFLVKSDDPTDKRMFTTRPMMTLTQMAYEAVSPYVLSSKRLVLSSTANLEDNGSKKVVQMYTSYCRPIRGLSEKGKTLIPKFAEAVDITMKKCGGEQEQGKHAINLDLGSIVETMHLGTAGGINQDQGKTITKVRELDAVEDPNGKKYEVLQASCEAVVDFFTKDIRPVTTFKNSEKQDNQFCDFESEVAAKEEKARIFVIPNLPTILIEHTVGFVRQLEVGGGIAIGHSWSQGGMDALLKSAGVYDDLESYDLNEGDLKNQDQSIPDVLINLFFASRIRYFNPKHRDYQRAKKALQFLIEEFTQRITHIIDAIWAIICGGVPSGALHTSHMDSWILLFLYVLFFLHQLERFPQHASQIISALMAKLVKLYGDDTWYFVKKGVLSTILNIKEFGAFLMEYFGITMKDMRVGHPVVSIPRNGYLEVVGGRYLRHYCVLNPIQGLRQPRYLPYRPMKEIVLKVIYGREPKPRDMVNLLLSILGHAYGTYGSNLETYNWLLIMYRLVLQTAFDGKMVDLSVLERAEKDVLRKCRQVNITSEQLLCGFPTLMKLYTMNEYNAAFHDVEAVSLRAAFY